ncbi:hypothetical protein ACI2I2_01365 [Scandinavium sp. NPDC088450]|uniref:hypothetical protein n=1 Tax=Scandinavium sp. NPDC088450 TaxID=3364514 RepID=UPI00384E1006
MLNTSLNPMTIRKKMLPFAFALLLPLVIQPAQSSTTEAWNAGDKAMVAACKNASGLKNVKVIRAITHFDDSVGYSVLLQQGVYPQKHMNGKQGKEMCLFKRATQKATVTETEWQ